MPRSMTGFARTESQQDWGTLNCEIRSVNHRYLEPTIRLPETLRPIENDLRNQLRKTLARGKIEVQFFLKSDSGGSELAINQEFAKNLIELAKGVQTELDDAAPLNALDVMRWPGVLQSSELDPKTVQSLAKELFKTTLEQLIANREREGEELQTFIKQRLDDIDSHVAIVRKALPEILQLNEDKLKAKLEALQVDIDQDRLAQELVHIAQKSDVAEELDRLEAHITEVQHTLKQNKPIGRRLDFLMQEFNREANTLSSKSMASETTQSAVELKVLIEQMREQIQNIE